MKSGSKKDVWLGKAPFWGKRADKTVDDLMLNKQGKLVNRIASESARARSDRGSRAVR